MALKLNVTREAYQEFYGSNASQMQKLIEDGRVPMNVAQLMQKRLDVRNSDAEIKSSYMDNYFDTGDGVAYNINGNLKVVLDSQILRDMIPNTPRLGGALLLTKDVYNALEGEEFKKGKLGKINQQMSRKDVKANPIWRVLARDQALLNDYADYIFVEGKERFGYDEAMGIFPDLVSDQPKMRAWNVYGLESRSYADGGSNLDSDRGRFVGIAPEALVSGNGGASRIKTYTLADLQAVDKALNGLEGTLHPDVLKPFVDLRKKL